MRTSFKNHAVALPIVLWCIAFIAGLVVLVGGAVGNWATEEARAERTFRARQMALSGLALGLNPAVKTGEPLLKSGSLETEGYEVKLSNESGKINPNYWIATNQRDIFLRLFEFWKVDEKLASSGVDGLIDWIDADDFRSLAGAETAEYTAAGRAGFPANKPLVNAREMESVIGLNTILSAHPEWRELFSTWHNGKINIQYADAAVLTSIGLLTPRQCQALFELRAGPDAVEGNDDDVQLESIEAAAQLAGADGVQTAALEAFFDVSGDVRRVESTGFCNGTRHRIVVITSGEGGGQIMSWEEQ